MFVAGAIGIVVIVVFSYAAYTKFANPFANHYTVHAVFSNANGLQADSLVRIAGVNVGKVTGVSDRARLQVGDDHGNGLQRRRRDDADRRPTACRSIRTRPSRSAPGSSWRATSSSTSHPGTPNAPVAGDGYIFPIQQGIEPVQLDQVLTGLQANTRKNLQTLLQQYGKAVEAGGPAYNRSIQYWLPAYEYSSLVAHDFLGIQPHDLSNYIAAQGTAAGAIDHNPPDLKSLVTDFNTTAFAFAREQANLRAHRPQSSPRRCRRRSRPSTRSTPPSRRSNGWPARCCPGVRSTGPTVDASLPFITQLRLLVQPSELRGLTHDLQPDGAGPGQAHARERSRCSPSRSGPPPAASANVIIPWTQLTVPDSHFDASNGFPSRQVYVEGVDYLPGLAGESRVFDANGPYIRILGVGGTLTYSLSPAPVRSVAGPAELGAAAAAAQQHAAGLQRDGARARPRRRSPTCRRPRRRR